jgi:hypothetical protein
MTTERTVPLIQYRLKSPFAQGAVVGSLVTHRSAASGAGQQPSSRRSGRQLRWAAKDVRPTGREFGKVREQARFYEAPVLSISFYACQLSPDQSGLQLESAASVVRASPLRVDRFSAIFAVTWAFR